MTYILRNLWHSSRTGLRTLSTRRSIRLTSDGTRFLLFTLAISIAAINTGNNLFYLLLATMLSLVVVSGLLSEQCLRRLVFHRHVPDLITANDPATVSISITNRNRRIPSFSVRVLDVMEGRDVERGLFIRELPARRSILLSYSLLATKRGRLRIDQIRAETLFPFGLFLKRALYSVETNILVGPPIKPLSLRFVDDLISEGQGQSLPRRGHGTQLYNLRHYRAGDDSRTIHWMTTARTSQLIVRETEAEDQRRIIVVLSCIAPEHLDQLFERCITFIGSLLWHLSKRNYPLRLVAGVEDSGLGTGSEHLLAMMRLLATCERSTPELHAVGEPALTVPEGLDGSYVLAVIPWAHQERSKGKGLVADRILQGSQLEELVRAF